MENDRTHWNYTGFTKPGQALYVGIVDLFTTQHLVINGFFFQYTEVGSLENCWTWKDFFFCAPALKTCHLDAQSST